MKGTLEILCGPSGVGKTSGMDKKSTVPYTYTTRTPRNDADAKTRRFVSHSEFETLLQHGDIVAPYDAFGNRYGFASDLRDALSNGDEVSEQIAPFSALEGVVEAFQDYGDIRKILFLTCIDELRRRLFGRKEYNNERESENIRIVLDYLTHLDEFDDVIYIYPDALSSEDSVKYIDILLTDIHAGKEIELEYDNLDGSFGMSVITLSRIDYKEDLVAYLESKKEVYSRKPGHILYHTYPSRGVLNHQLERLGLISEGVEEARIFKDIFGIGYLMEALFGNVLGDLFDSYEAQIKSISETGAVTRYDFIGMPLQRHLIDRLNSPLDFPMPLPPDFVEFNRSYRTMPLLIVLRMANVLIDLNKKESCFAVPEPIHHTLLLLDQQLNMSRFQQAFTVALEQPQDNSSFIDDLEGRKMFLLRYFDVSDEVRQGPAYADFRKFNSTSQFLNIPIDVAYLGMVMDNLLNFYCSYRGQLDFFDSYMCEMALKLTERCERYVSFNGAYPKYPLQLNSQFLGSVIRIMSSDPSRPNSRENLWSYPLRTEAKDFVGEYWVFDYPSKGELYERISANRKTIASMLK